MLQGEAVVCRDLAGYAQVTNSMTEPATDVPQLVSGILLTIHARRCPIGREPRGDIFDTRGLRARRNGRHALRRGLSCIHCRRILSIPVDRFANLLLWARDKASETKFHTRHSARHKHRFREWGRETNQTAESKIGGGRLSTTGIVQLPRSC